MKRWIVLSCCLISAIIFARLGDLSPARALEVGTPSPDEVVDKASSGIAQEELPADGIIYSGVRTAPRHAPAAPGAIAASLMTQNFEGVWPSTGWALYDDSSSDNGNYTWGKRNCHPRNGGYAGWGHGGGGDGGYLPCGASYPNYTETWAVYGPFDLSNASSASLVFYFWGEAESMPGSTTSCYDFLFYGGSNDGLNFDGQFVCGTWTQGTAGNGYYKRTYNLSQWLGQPVVYIGFNFSGDVSYNMQGIHIDDITLTAETGGTLNGYVFVDTNASGTRDAGETTGVNGVRLKLSGPNTNREATTNASGWYAFTSLPAGSFTITETQPIGFTSTSPDVVIKTLQTNETKSVNFGEQLVGTGPTVTPSPTDTPTITPTPVTPVPGPSGRLAFLPLMVAGTCDRYGQNDTADRSYGPLSPYTPYRDIFCAGEQHDYYYVDLGADQNIRITLNDIPVGTDFDLYLYKAPDATTAIAKSDRYQNLPEEIVYRTAHPGRYYILVFRPQAQPAKPNEPYTLRIEY